MTEFGVWVVAWVIGAIGLQLYWWKQRLSAGWLVLAYALTLSLIHWPGGAIYLLPWYSNHDVDIVFSGFRESAVGFLSFAVGSALLAPILIRALPFFSRRVAPRSPDPRLVKAYLAVGFVSYLFLIPLVRYIPSGTALTSAGWELVVVGFALGCWKSWRERNVQAFLLWFAIALGLPFFTIVTQGFLGYGTVALLSVAAFAASFYRPRWQVLLVALVFTYIAFSFYVTYMRDRVDIRRTVWGEQAVESRVSQVLETVATVEWFDLHNQEHLARIDDRLNQNFLVGAAVLHLKYGEQEFARGGTLVDAVLALVPRALWPSKAAVGGSGDLVTRFTGIPFAEGTSVGIGQVMEFYVNFGTQGVVLGFLAIGVVITLVDRLAWMHLTAGDWQGFAFWCLPGIALLQAGGALVEVTSSTAAALVTAYLVNRFLLQNMRGRKRALVTANRRASSAAINPSPRIQGRHHLG